MKDTSVRPESKGTYSELNIAMFSFQLQVQIHWGSLNGRGRVYLALVLLMCCHYHFARLRERLIYRKQGISSERYGAFSLDKSRMCRADGVDGLQEMERN